VVIHPLATVEAADRGRSGPVVLDRNDAMTREIAGATLARTAAVEAADALIPGCHRRKQPVDSGLCAHSVLRRCTRANSYGAHHLVINDDRQPAGHDEQPATDG